MFLLVFLEICTRCLVKLANTLQRKLTTDATEFLVKVVERITKLSIGLCIDWSKGWIDAENLLEDSGVKELQVEYDDLLVIPGVRMLLVADDDLLD